MLTASKASCPTPGMPSSVSTKMEPPISAGQLEAEDRDDRQHGVADDVPEDDDVAAQTLRARRAHEVLVQHLDHLRAHVAREPGDARQRQHQHRQDGLQ